MPTKPERQALAFFAVVTVLGVGVKVWRSEPPPVPSVEERLALASQVAATDSAAGAAAERKARAGKGRANGSGRTRRPTTGPPEAREEQASRQETSWDRQGGATSGAEWPASPDRQAPPVNPDDATAAELERLPWVGPALAARIVADREAHGPFGSIEGLTRVRGIGPKLAERLRPLVTFSGPVRPRSAAPGGAVTRAGERLWAPAGHSPRP